MDRKDPSHIDSLLKNHRSLKKVVLPFLVRLSPLEWPIEDAMLSGRFGLAFNGADTLFRCTSSVLHYHEGPILRITKPNRSDASIPYP